MPAHRVQSNSFPSFVFDSSSKSHLNIFFFFLSIRGKEHSLHRCSEPPVQPVIPHLWWLAVRFGSDNTGLHSTSIHRKEGNDTFFPIEKEASHVVVLKLRHRSNPLIATSLHKKCN